MAKCKAIVLLNHLPERRLCLATLREHGLIAELRQTHSSGSSYLY
jgi:hypothetical protein